MPGHKLASPAEGHLLCEALLYPDHASLPVSHFDLLPPHGPLLGFIQHRPPSFERIDDELTGLGRAPKGDAQLRTVFIHDP